MWNNEHWFWKLYTGICLLIGNIYLGYYSAKFIAWVVISCIKNW